MFFKRLFWLLASILWTTTAAAHVSEQGFVLLLPTNVYIAGGVSAVALTVILLAFVSPAKTTGLFKNARLFQVFSTGKLYLFTSLVSVFFLMVLLYTGVQGSRDPLSNPLPLFIWTVWWIGFVTLQGLLGDIWRWVNPWVGLHGLLHSVLQLTPRRIPHALGHWPGIVIFIAIMGFMLADLAPDDPDRLAGFIIAYYVFTLIGMLVFGEQAWLSRCEPFTMLLRFYALLAPFKHEKNSEQAGLHAGVPGWRAYQWSVKNPLSEQANSFSVSASVFVLLMLGMGSFDGLNETFWWLDKIGINPLEFPGRSAITTETVVGLLAANLLLVLIFASCVALGLRLVNATELAKNSTAPVSFKQAFTVLAIGILPIAFAYHVAHFLTAFMVNIQYSVAAFSDPMHTGADFLGLGTFYVTTGFFNAHHTVQAIWLFQAGTVVLGHLLSVLLTHALAVKLWNNGRSAVIGQIPIAVFMIFYTFLGLWLLASPRGA